jgi:hypothetical protein
MRGEWVAMRRESSASKRVSFGSTVLIPLFPSSEDTHDESDEDGSLDPEELFGSDGSDEGSITLEELVRASEYVATR